MKRLKFILKALVEIIRATKGYACDKAIVIMTEEELIEYQENLHRMGIQLQLCYQCIDTMVMGGTPCYLCNDYKTCEHAGKDSRAPMCDIWDLVELTPANREERVEKHEPAAATQEGEADPGVCEAKS